MQLNADDFRQSDRDKVNSFPLLLSGLQTGYSLSKSSSQSAFLFKVGLVKTVD